MTNLDPNLIRIGNILVFGKEHHSSLGKTTVLLFNGSKVERSNTPTCIGALQHPTVLR